MSRLPSLSPQLPRPPLLAKAVFPLLSLSLRGLSLCLVPASVSPPLELNHSNLLTSLCVDIRNRGQPCRLCCLFQQCFSPGYCWDGIAHASRPAQLYGFCSEISSVKYLLTLFLLQNQVLVLRLLSLPLAALLQLAPLSLCVSTLFTTWIHMCST